jgi:uncharacterized membrane protein YcaP (DUF421 family)
MNIEEIQWWDWNRIMIGEAPVDFMLEVFIRTLIVFIILLFVMRMFGKKMGNTYSILEFSVVITLGAIVCVPMQIPDRGIIPATIILLCVVFYYWLINRITTLNHTSGKLAVGKTRLLVKDGLIDFKELRRQGISREQLFSKLRGAQIKNLGTVKRVYFEATGQFSIYTLQQAKPGLSTIPRVDNEFAKNDAPGERWFACSRCGQIERKPNMQCANCGDNRWESAVNTGVEQTKTYLK